MADSLVNNNNCTLKTESMADNSTVIRDEDQTNEAIIINDQIPNSTAIDVLEITDPSAVVSTDHKDQINCIASPVDEEIPSSTEYKKEVGPADDKELPATAEASSPTGAVADDGCTANALPDTTDATAEITIIHAGSILGQYTESAYNEKQSASCHQERLEQAQTQGDTTVHTNNSAVSTDTQNEITDGNLEIVNIKPITEESNNINQQYIPINNEDMSQHSPASIMQAQRDVISTIDTSDNSNKVIEGSMIKQNNGSMKNMQSKKIKKTVQFFEKPIEDAPKHVPEYSPNWPLSNAFTVETAEVAILDYVDNAWDIDEKWLRCIDYLGVSDGIAKEHMFRVRFSQPTRRKPIPSYTSSVYFSLISGETETDPMRVWYKMEGQRLVHRPEEHTFQEKWLNDILSAKAAICSETSF